MAQTEYQLIQMQAGSSLVVSNSSTPSMFRTTTVLTQRNTLHDVLATAIAKTLLDVCSLRPCKSDFQTLPTTIQTKMIGNKHNSMFTTVALTSTEPHSTTTGLTVQNGICLTP
jgi:hypothetical protein